MDTDDPRYDDPHDGDTHGPRYQPNLYTGTQDPDVLLEALRRAAVRIGVRPRELVVRAKKDSDRVRLAMTVGGCVVERACDSQPTLMGNLGALVGWATALARNAERGIETVGEALYGDGVALTVKAGAPPSDAPINAYTGPMPLEEAWCTVLRALDRLGLDRDGAWLGPAGERGAALRVRLDPRHVVEKRSYRQADARCNGVVLALWLRDKARHHERGIERDLRRTLSAYLLGSGQ